MSSAELRAVMQTAEMLKDYGCDMSYRIRGHKVRFTNKKGTVNMSRWLSVQEARIWADGFVIGYGHQPEKKGKQ